MNEEIRIIGNKWLRESGPSLNGDHPTTNDSFYDLIHKVLEDKYDFTVDDIYALINEVYPDKDMESQECDDFANKWYIIYEHIKSYTNRFE